MTDCTFYLKCHFLCDETATKGWRNLRSRKERTNLGLIPSSAFAHWDWEGKWTASAQLTRGRGGGIEDQRTDDGGGGGEFGLPDVKFNLTNTRMTFRYPFIPFEWCYRLFVAISVTIGHGFCWNVLLLRRYGGPTAKALFTLWEESGYILEWKISLLLKF